MTVMTAEWNNFLRWYSTIGNLYFDDRQRAWQCWQTFRAHNWRDEHAA